jgi:hypothetical protein
MGLAEVNLIVFDSVLGKPLERNSSLARNDLTDIPPAGLHVSRGANDHVVPGGPQGAKFLDRARNRLEVGILLSLLSQLADHAIEINADSHESAVV